jgi:hypothetical protein
MMVLHQDFRLLRARKARLGECGVARHRDLKIDKDMEDIMKACRMQ